MAPGTVFVGLSLPGQPTQTRQLRVPGDRERSASEGRFPPFTCSDAPSTPTTPERPRSQEAHSGATLDGGVTGATL